MSARRPNADRLATLVEAVSGRAIGDTALLEAAFTHASERPQGGSDYQRLEFLGDRVLGLVVAELVHERFPHASEGDLSLRLNAMVRAETLAEIAEEIGLSDHIRASGAVKGNRSRKAVNLRADVMEALIAVLYLDGGLEAARDFVHRYWDDRLNAETAARRDAKTALQEWAHQAHGGTPLYETRGREGPDHAPVFTMSVTIEGLDPATGKGRSKREAEQAAAEALLKREGAWDER
jgi:ribonuclease III